MLYKLIYKFTKVDDWTLFCINSKNILPTAINHLVILKFFSKILINSCKKDW